MCRATSTTTEAQLQALQGASAAAADKLRAAQEENRDLSARLAVAETNGAKLKVSAGRHRFGRPARDTGMHHTQQVDPAFYTVFTMSPHLFIS